MTSIVIVGGGIIGAACAFELATVGAEVTLLDAGDPPSGSTARCDGYLLPSDKRLDLVPVCIEALAAWRRIAPTLGDIEFIEESPLLVATDPLALQRLRERAADLSALGLGVQELDGDACKRLEPGLTPNVMGGLVTDEDARVQPMLATIALLRGARDSGAVVRTHAAVRAVEPGRVMLDNDEIGADEVIVAAGPWSAGLLRHGGWSIPIEPRRGHLLVIERRAAAHVRRGALDFGYIASSTSAGAELSIATVVEATQSGTVLVGASRERVGFHTTPDPAILRSLAGAAARLYPGLASCRVLRSWTGFRPWTPDGWPLVGRLAPGLILASGHEGGGIALGPLTGQLVRRLILDGREPHPAMDPCRFSGGERFPPTDRALHHPPPPQATTVWGGQPSVPGEGCDGRAQLTRPTPTASLKERHMENHVETSNASGSSVDSSTLTRRAALGRAAALGGAAMSASTLSGLLAACGSSTTSPNGDALRIAVSSNAQSLDPHTFFLPRALEMDSNLFDTFMAGAPQEQDGKRVSNWLDAQPAFAEAAQLNDSRTKLTLKIPKGKRFASGNPVTMDDVLYSFQRLGALPIGAAIYSSISVDPRTGVKRIDARTVELRASHPVTYLPAVLCEPHVALWDSKEMKKHATAADPWSTKWTATHIAPSGPYVIESVQSGGDTVLGPNPHFDRYKPGFPKVLLRVIPSVSDRVGLLLRGDIDYAEDLPKQSIKQLTANKDLVITSDRSIEQVYLGMNVALSPFRSKQLRQAVNWALPYDEIVQNVYFGQAHRMRSMMPEDTPTFDPTLAYYSYDPERAKALARASGETPISVELPFDTAQPEHSNVAAIIQAALKPLGVSVTLRPTEGAAFAEGKAKKAFALFLDQVLFWINDPAYIMDLLVSSNGAVNLVNYHDQRADQLIKEGQSTLDRGRREAVFGELQKKLVEEALWAPIVHPNLNVVTRKSITGYRRHPSQMTYYSDFRRSAT